MAALTLAEAAGAAFDNLQIRWNNNGLKSALTQFFNNGNPLFPDSEPDSQALGDWFIPLGSLATNMAATNVPILELTQAAQIVYRLCWLAQVFKDNGSISSTQATTLLAYYNLFIGF